MRKPHLHNVRRRYRERFRTRLRGREIDLLLSYAWKEIAILEAYGCLASKTSLSRPITELMIQKCYFKLPTLLPGLRRDSLNPLALEMDI